MLRTFSILAASSIRHPLKNIRSMSCCKPKAAAPPPPEKAAACCGPKASPAVQDASVSAAFKEDSSCRAPSSQNGANLNGHAVSHADVSEYYGKAVQKQSDLQTSACLVKGEDTATRQLLKNVHEDILAKFYGCGSPIPPLLSGTTVLDLGCGTGRDVYVCAQLVGEAGTVIGIDMTDEQLAVARQLEEWHRERFGYAKSNVSFRKGLIEDLKGAGVQDNSVDAVISNCVINLAPDKAPVLAEVGRVLKPGGELYFSDVFADRRIPEHLRKDKVLCGECLSGALYLEAQPRRRLMEQAGLGSLGVVESHAMDIENPGIALHQVLYGECLSGALYLEDFRRLMAQAGLGAWGVVDSRAMDIENPAIAEALGDIQFYSATVRAIKLPQEAEGALHLDSPEDFGQVATYSGGIPQCPSEFTLDELRVFPRDAAVPVDATTAAMLQASRYAPFFAVTERGPHRGIFRSWFRFPASVPGCTDLSQYRASSAKGACC